MLTEAGWICRIQAYNLLVCSAGFLNEVAISHLNSLRLC